MPQSALEVMYSKETIKGFEKRQSLLRRTVTTKSNIEGHQATFLVADSGGGEATTRGANGDIPSTSGNREQPVAQLQEWHDLRRRNGFNIYTSQGDERALMQQESIAVLNRRIDTDIASALAEATNTWGAAAVATLTLVIKSKTILLNNFAGEDDIFARITPAYYGYLLGLEQFTNVDYINMKPFEGVNKSDAFNWYGVNWIVDAAIEGVGTSAAKCHMYAKSAVGHACDTENLSTEIGYDKEQDRSFARATAYMGSKMLQNKGIIQMLHDDSALSA